MEQEIKYCKYGCGKEAKFQLKNGNWICSKSHNSCLINRNILTNKLKEAHKNNKFPKDCFGEKRSWSKGLTKQTDDRIKKQAEKIAVKLEDILSGKTTYLNISCLRERLINEGIKERKCEICGIENWLCKNLSFSLHHKDGNRKNNKLYNLQILCPNCHTQTDNYGKKKKNKVQ